MNSGVRVIQLVSPLRMATFSPHFLHLRNISKKIQTPALKNRINAVQRSSLGIFVDAISEP